MIRSLLLCLASTLSGLHAQDPPAISTRILTYAPAGLPDGMTAYFRNGRDIELLRASAGTLGLPLEYQGPPTFAIYASKEDLLPPAAGAPPPVPTATVQLPETADMVLILCTRDARDQVGLIAYDISSGNLRPGDYHVFNFSRSMTSVILGDQRFALQPGKDAAVRDPAWSGEAMALPLKIAVPENGKPKLVYSSFWEHYPQRRNLMFLFDGRHPSQPVRFVSFNAELPPPPAETTP